MGTDRVPILATDKLVRVLEGLFLLLPVHFCQDLLPVHFLLVYNELRVLADQIRQVALHRGVHL